MKKNIYIPLFSLFILGSCGSDKGNLSEFAQPIHIDPLK